MQHRAKFGADQTVRCGDMAIFRFFKMAAVNHIGFVTGRLGPSMKSAWWSLSLSNLVGMDAVVSTTWTF